MTMKVCNRLISIMEPSINRKYIYIRQGSATLIKINVRRPIKELRYLLISLDLVTPECGGGKILVPTVNKI